MKLCINCKHYDNGMSGSNYIDIERCMRPVADPVHGQRGHYVPPRDERTEGLCGPDAKFFEDKPKVPTIWERLNQYFGGKHK